MIELKNCKSCDRPMALKVRRDKSIESPGAYARRHYCNSKCYGQSLLGKPWGRGAKK